MSSTNKPESRFEPLRGVLAPMVAEGASNKEIATALNAAGFMNEGGREWNWASVSVPLVVLGLRERNLERFTTPPSFSD